MKKNNFFILFLTFIFFTQSFCVMAKVPKITDELKGENLSLSAKAVASSCDKANKAYSISTLNDGKNAYGFEPSWVNVPSNLPSSGTVWAGLEWENNVTVNIVTLYTVQGFEISDYDIQISDNDKWVTVLSIKGNTEKKMEHIFEKSLTTKKLRILCLKGSDGVQAEFTRLTEIETFNAKISNQDILSRAKDNLVLENTDGEKITLPKHLLDKTVNVKWKSSNPEIINSDGEIFRPQNGGGAKKVILTAELYIDEDTAEKEFEITVKELEEDEKVVENIYDKLSLGECNIIQNVVLPTSDEKNYTNIKWESSNPTAISNDGIVHRNKEKDELAKLTATISKGNIVKEKVFDVTVLKQLSDMEVQTAQLWNACEVSFNSTKIYDNCYLDVDMDVYFTSPSGKVMIQPAFWDGDSIWRVRFAPTELGEWNYITVCNNSDDIGLHGRTGKINSIEYTGTLDIYKHGFVKREEGKRYLTYADGTPFFYISDCNWFALSSRAPLYKTNMPETGSSMFKTIIDTRVKQGYNAYRTNFFIGLGGDMSSSGTYNEGGFPWSKGLTYRTAQSTAAVVDENNGNMICGAIRAFDGAKGSFFRAIDNKYPQWLQIDYSERKALKTVELSFKRDDIWDFSIDISNDGEHFSSVYKTPNEGFCGKEFTFEFPKNIAARFFRVTVNGCKSKNVLEVNEVLVKDSNGIELNMGHYYKNLNPDFFKNTDERIKYIVDNGLIANLGLDWGRQMQPGLEEEYKRFSKYVIARYGAYPTMWHTAGEAATGAIEPWITVAKYTKSTDPYDRVNTIHNSILNLDYSEITDDLSWQDVSYTQSGHDRYDFVDTAYWNKIYNREPVKPFIEAEAIFENILGNASYVSREVYWKTVMAGGVGFGYSAEGLWQSTYDWTDKWQVWGAGAIPWYLALYKEAGAQLPYMKKFFETINWWELIPNNNAVIWNNAPKGIPSPFQKSNLDNSVITAYVPSSKSAYNGVAMLRPNSEFTAKFYNTRTGEFTLIDDKIQTDQTGMWKMPKVPDNKTDWAIMITINTINTTDFMEISFEKISTEQPYNVKNNLNLINKTTNGANVIWESSNNNIINSQTGKVVAQNKDEKITLISKIKTDKGEDVKYFYLTVTGKQ